MGGAVNRCEDCGQPRPDVRTVEIIEQDTGPGGARRACERCVPLGHGVLEREWEMPQ